VSPLSQDRTQEHSPGAALRYVPEIRFGDKSHEYHVQESTVDQQKIQTCARHKWTYKVPHGECPECKREREEDRRERTFEVNMLDLIQ